MANTGGRVKMIREQHNMTQADLAGKVGVSRSHIAKIENNDTDGSVAILKKLASALGVSAAELLGEPSAKGGGG